MRAKGYTREQVLAAVIGSGGIMSNVAVKLECSWPAADRYVKKWAETRNAFDAQRVKLNSLAYSSFATAIRKGERWAVERILDTSARHDGHGLVSKIELSGPEGGAIKSESKASVQIEDSVWQEVAGILGKLMDERRAPDEDGDDEEAKV